MSYIKTFRDWTRDSITNLGDRPFTDIHIDGVEERWIKNGQVEFRRIVGFLEAITQDSVSTHTSSACITLHVGLSFRDGGVTLCERELMEPPTPADAYTVIDGRTPPNLYILRNPLDIILFKMSRIRRIFKSGDWHVILKSYEDQDDFDENLFIINSQMLSY